MPRHRSALATKRMSVSVDLVNLVRAAKGFEKVLASDLDESTILKMMLEVRATRAEFREFTNNDLTLLSRMMTSIVVYPQDKIINKHEKASFIAIVLRGSFAIGQHAKTATYHRGDVMGAHEYFLPTVRPHDIVASAKAVVAIFAFKDVDQLGNCVPEMFPKMLRFLTRASLLQQAAGFVDAKFVQQQVEAQTAAAGAAASDAVSTSAAPSSSRAGSPKKPHSRAASAKAGHMHAIREAAAKADAAAKEAPEESLWKRRLQRQGGAPPQLIETPEAHRVEMANEKMNLNAIAVSVRQKVHTIRDELKAKKKELAETTELLVSAKAGAADLTLTNALLQKQILELEGANLRIRSDLDQLRVESRTLLLAQQNEMQQVAKDAQVERVRLGKDLAQARTHAFVITEALLRAHCVRRCARWWLAQTRQKRIERALKKEKALSSQLNAELKKGNEQNRKLSGQLLEARENIEQLNVHVTDAERRDLEWRNRVDGLDYSVERLNKVKERLERDSANYAKLLRAMALRGFCRFAMLRTKMRKMFRRVCEMTTQLLALQLEYLPATDASNQLDTPNALHGRVRRKMRTPLWMPVKSRAAIPSVLRMTTDLESELSLLEQTMAAVMEEQSTWKATAKESMNTNITLRAAKVDTDERLLSYEAKLEEANELAMVRDDRISDLESTLKEMEQSEEIRLREARQTEESERTARKLKRKEAKALFEKSVTLQRRIQQLEVYLHGLDRQREVAEETMRRDASQRVELTMRQQEERERREKVPYRTNALGEYIDAYKPNPSDTRPSWVKGSGAGSPASALPAGGRLEGKERARAHGGAVQYFPLGSRTAYGIIRSARAVAHGGGDGASEVNMNRKRGLVAFGASSTHHHLGGAASSFGSQRSPHKAWRSVRRKGANHSNAGDSIRPLGDSDTTSDGGSRAVALLGDTSRSSHTTLRISGGSSGHNHNGTGALVGANLRSESVVPLRSLLITKEKAKKERSPPAQQRQDLPQPSAVT